MDLGTRIGFLLAAMFALVFVGIAVVWYIRKRLLAPLDDEAEEEDYLYTTAQVEALKRDGLIDGEKYEKLKGQAAEAAKLRAKAARRRKRGIFN